MKLDCRTALALIHPDNKQVLLLKRSATKKLLPNLITGIGGKVELQHGEGEDLKKSLLREFSEETKIDIGLVSEISLKLTTLNINGGYQVLIFWFAGKLAHIPTDLTCNEGVLNFYNIDSLPLEDFTPHAREAIPFILALQNQKIYTGIFNSDGKLIVSES